MSQSYDFLRSKDGTKVRFKFHRPPTYQEFQGFLSDLESCYGTPFNLLVDTANLGITTPFRYVNDLVAFVQRNRSNTLKYMTKTAIVARNETIASLVNMVVSKVETASEWGVHPSLDPACEWLGWPVRKKK